MKINALILVIAICYSINSYSQDRPAFRKGYLRVGINKLGDDLDNSLSPKENIFDSKYGASTGYVFEFGKIYYFKSRENKGLINYGLDWTILSLNYNKMDKWEEYGLASEVGTSEADGSLIAAAISSKLGPTISFNPLEKLEIDVRFQIAPTLRFFDFEYYEDDENSAGRYFYFENSAQSEFDEDFDSEAIKNRLAFGVATGFGITVRRKAIGIALDYTVGKVNSNYEAFDPRSGMTYGKERIKANTMQFKLSFTL